MMNLLTTGEIKSIERVCENLNKWQKGDIPQDFKELGRHSQLIMLVQPLINDVVVDLLAQMPDEGRLVRDKFEEFLNQAKFVDDLREKASEDALFEDSTLLRLAWEFILILRRIAQKGSQDLTSTYRNLTAYWEMFKPKMCKLETKHRFTSSRKQKSKRLLLPNGGEHGLVSKKYHVGFTILLVFLRRCSHVYISRGGYGKNLWPK